MLTASDTISKCVWCITLVLLGTDWLNDWLIYIWVWDLMFPMHLGLNCWALCAPHQFMGRVGPCYFAKVPDGPPELHSWCPLAPRSNSPDTRVCLKLKIHTHIECGLRFHPLFRTSYTTDRLTPPLGEDVSWGYYVSLGKWSCCPQYTYRLSNPERSTKDGQISYLGDVPQEWTVSPCHVPLNGSRVRVRSFDKGKNLKTLRPGNWRHMLKLMKIFQTLILLTWRIWWDANNASRWDLTRRSEG